MAMRIKDTTFVFVAHIGGGSTAREDKSIINAHVSRHSASRRRISRALKAQAKNSLTKQLASVNHTPAIRAKSSQRRSSTQTISDVRPLQISPRSPIDHGNCDPFNSVSLKIDSKANYYLRFGGEILESSIHGAGYRGWLSSMPSRQDYLSPDLLVGGCPGYCGANNRAACLAVAGHGVACFRILGYGVLACCASGVATLTSNQVARNDALSYTASTMRYLREYLKGVTYDTDNDLELLVYRLYRAEVLARNYQSASAHGRLLKSIFEHRARCSSLRLDMLSTALYQDGQRMFGSWTRPIFDQDWVEREYSAAWTEAETMFDKDLYQQARNISQEVADSTLRSILASAKQLFLQTVVQAERQQQAQPHNFYWFEARGEWLQMRLMNYYLDLDRHPAAEDSNLESVDDAINMCLVLAVLCVIRHAKNEVLINDRPLYSGCNNIVAQFDRRLSTLARTITQNHLSSKMEVFTFILFIAALAEHYTEPTPSPMRIPPVWRKRFGEFLLLNNLTSRSKVLPIIERFPYTEMEVALPSEHWIEDMVGASSQPGSRKIFLSL